MNEALTNLMQRRSIKAYREEQIPQDLLNQILEAGTYAPTGKGAQAPVMVVIREKAMVQRLSKMNAAIMGAKIDPFYGAPTVVIVLADKEMPTYLYDGSLVMGNLMIAANALGIGSCWIHRAKEMFETEEGKELLQKWGLSPDKYEGIGNCIMGYAKGEPSKAKPRKEGYIVRT